MNVRHIGRFKVQDGRTTGRIGDTAEKMELARFTGHEIVAERDGEDLVIYQIGDPDGIGVNVTGATGDRRAVKNLADLQKTFDNFTKSVDRRYMTPRRG
jgi:hypothetical protein